MTAQEIANLKAQIAALTTGLTETQHRLSSIATANITVTNQYQDCTPHITNESQINLEIFKTLPIFTGDKNQYRSWRKRAWTHMENIKNYSTTPTYYTALSIIHSKIQGEAADILINHDTKFHFYDIIDHLDYTYADQRPLHVLLEEMKRIRQEKRTLAEFHCEVSKALNLALTKVEMDSSGNPSPMKEYANKEAVRTFILGLNSKYTSGTLYSHNPNDLETAYAIASTIYHDNVNSQFDVPQYNQHRQYNSTLQYQNQGRRYYEIPQRYRPNVQVQYNQTAPRQQHEPMDVDPSQQYTRSANRNHSAPQRNSYDRQMQGLAPNNPFRGDPQKRDRNPSSRNYNTQQKVQRVNQTREEKLQSLAPEYENDEYETGSVFLRRINDLPCLQRHCRDTGKLINILIDTGATNNYISTKCNIGESISIKPVKVKTLHGYSITKSKKIVTLLEHNITFFETDALEEFDMLLGEQGLRKIKAEIDLFEYKLSYKYRAKKESESVQKINFTVNNEKYIAEIEKIMQKNEVTNEVLPYTTTIQATIRTKSEDPIWTKQYPYPMSDNDFINTEIKKLLKNKIIQPSKSPYNSPIWTVAKKGTDEQGKAKRRMVVDFQKLNAQTITDRYPIPDVAMTIQNLGNAKVFTTLDLESGFHQILINESDREKTAFSVNGAKYEFLRMPFGLKNAPSIFQRCVDDILRPYIGKFAYVYIDDVLIYSSSPEEHIEHIRIIINALHQANMKISNEKSHFFQDSVEYLGHIIKYNRITVDPKKIQTIKDFPIPITLKELRSFLGLASYYRKFIQNFAAIVKPLTTFLRGENGGISKNQSAKIKITLDEPALEALEKIKEELQAQVELFQPNFNKPFELTTDASNYAIGAVLSQNRKPISFISRTLNQTEQNYSTNEKELLAIVWSLQKLRNYLYGIADLTIYTDHQSLIFSISEKNPNTKLKRWKNFIEEYGTQLVYKRGHQNVVADALSRQQINNTSNSDDSQHSAQSSPTQKLKRVKQPLNSFRNQIIIKQSDQNLVEISSQNIFSNSRHTLFFNTKTELLDRLKNIIKPKVTNALQIDEQILFYVENDIINTFSTVSIVIAQKLVDDITETEQQEQIIQDTHKRAHRNYKNNAREISIRYYWPNIRDACKKEVQDCEICLTNKYERRPNKQPIGSAPIPNKVGEYIHLDLFFMSNNMYISSTDKYSKFCHLRQIPSKKDTYKYVDEILSQIYPNAKFVMTDNESTFTGICAQQIYKRLQITHTKTPAYHSTTNGQVERTHSTIIELAKVLAHQHSSAPDEQIFEAVRQYNKTIHSATNERPEDVFFNQRGYPDIKERLQQNQARVLRYHNRNRKQLNYKEGDVIYSKTHRRNKNVKKYAKHIVKKDNGDTITTNKRVIIHKDNIRVKACM